ncbi:MAG: hypothetical protein JW904_08380 [Spirochaetales bacterium]|nr:hypothetical protein [Spirochaetales bacterium]
MPLDPVHHGINISNSARQKLEISSGDFIWVKVLKQLAPGKYAVAIKGNVFPATTTMDLEPGSTIRAKADISGSSLFLRLGQTEDSPLSGILAKLGIQHTPENILIITTLMAQKLPLDPGMIRKINVLLRRLKGDPQKIVKLLSILIDKGISVENSDLESLYDTLFREKNESGHQKKSKFLQKKSLSQKEPEAPTGEIIQHEIMEACKNIPEHFAVLNHLRAKNENWVIIPFRGPVNNLLTNGILKLLYDPFLKTFRKSVVSVNLPDNRQIHFELMPAAGRKIMKLIAQRDMIKSIPKNIFREFQANLDTIGIKLDDSIYGDDMFNGFDFLDGEKHLFGIDTDG